MHIYLVGAGAMDSSRTQPGVPVAAGAARLTHPSGDREGKPMRRVGEAACKSIGIKEKRGKFLLAFGFFLFINQNSK